MLGSRSRDSRDHRPERTASSSSASIDALINRVLADADIQINGRRPWDMRIHHPETLSRIAAQRSLGLGESYMDGWWDCDALDEFAFRMLRAGDHRGAPEPVPQHRPAQGAAQSRLRYRIHILLPPPPA